MNNSVHVVGIVASSVEHSHTTGNEKFFTFDIDIKRASGVVDTINVVISERFLMDTEIKEGDTVEIRGQYRSFSKINDEGVRSVQLFIFVKNIIVCDADVEHVNEVELNGCIAKCYKCRHTKTSRDVIDFTFKVCRDYTRFDYLTCIAWGRNAMFIEKLCGEEGKSDTMMHITGRLQSRKYTKKYEDNTEEEKTVYELSVNDIQIIDETEQENEEA